MDSGVAQGGLELKPIKTKKNLKQDYLCDGL